MINLVLIGVTLLASHIFGRHHRKLWIYETVVAWSRYEKTEAWRCIGWWVAVPPSDTSSEFPLVGWEAIPSMVTQGILDPPLILPFRFLSRKS